MTVKSCFTCQKACNFSVAHILGIPTESNLSRRLRRREITPIGISHSYEVIYNR